MAIPTQKGQLLEVSDSTSEYNTLHWESFDESGKPFLKITFEADDFDVVKKEGDTPYYLLQDLLREARKRNPDFLKKSKAINAVSKLEFPMNWGLGSSSTLIYNIGQWSKTDPLELLFSVMDGSGYDVACAGAEEAILYRLQDQQAVWQEICFEPPFAEKIFFIHLGKKQNSSEAVRKYRNLPKNEKLINKISGLTDSMIRSVTTEEFQAAMEEHEDVVAEALNIEKVKNLLFPDFPGALKSLGAWGGDFIMACSDKHPGWISQYFLQKGFKTVISFEKMLFHPDDSRD